MSDQAKATMTDRDLANAAAVYFGGRARAEHWLTCPDCHLDVDDGTPVLCRAHPGRRAELMPRADPGVRALRT